MTTLLRLWRLFAAGIWFQVAALGALAVFPFGWGGIRRVGRFTRLWGAGLCRILGLQVRVCGEIPATPPRGLVVSNHLSYLDIIVHAGLFPVRFAPKAEIARWPVVGWYLALSRPVWVDRQSRQKSARTMAEFAATLEHGIPLIVYPEGTSTNGKEGLLPFKSTPFEAVKTAGDIPIQPMLIRYLEPLGRPPVCWYGDAALLPHAWQVLGMRRIEVAVRFLPPVQPGGRDRKTLAADLHRLMDEAYREWTGSSAKPEGATGPELPSAAVPA